MMDINYRRNPSLLRSSLLLSILNLSTSHPRSSHPRSSSCPMSLSPFGAVLPRPFMPSNTARRLRSRSSWKRLNVKRPVNARPRTRHGNPSFSSTSQATMASRISPIRAVRSSRGPRRVIGHLRVFCRRPIPLWGTISDKGQDQKLLSQNTERMKSTCLFWFTPYTFLFCFFRVSERHLWNR